MNQSQKWICYEVANILQRWMFHKILAFVCLILNYWRTICRASLSWVWLYGGVLKRLNWSDSKNFTKLFNVKILRIFTKKSHLSLNFCEKKSPEILFYEVVWRNVESIGFAPILYHRFHRSQHFPAFLKVGIHPMTRSIPISRGLLAKKKKNTKRLSE